MILLRKYQIRQEVRRKLGIPDRVTNPIIPMENLT